MIPTRTYSDSVSSHLPLLLCNHPSPFQFNHSVSTIPIFCWNGFFVVVVVRCVFVYIPLNAIRSAMSLLLWFPSISFRCLSYILAVLCSHIPIIKFKYLSTIYGWHCVGNVDFFSSPLCRFCFQSSRTVYRLYVACVCVLETKLLTAFLCVP